MFFTVHQRREEKQFPYLKHSEQQNKMLGRDEDYFRKLKVPKVNKWDFEKVVATQSDVTSSPLSSLLYFRLGLLR